MMALIVRRMATALRVLSGAGGLVCEDCGALRVYDRGNCQRCNDCGALRASATCRHWNADGSEA